MRTDLFQFSTALLILSVALVLLLRLRRQIGALLLAIGALLGAADLLFDGMAMQVERQWLNSEVSFTASIERVERHTGSLRYRLSDLADEQGTRLPGQALLYIYGSKRQSLLAGQRLRARAHWRLPRNYRNPGAFDYRAWCFDRRIALIGNVRGEIELLPSQPSWLERQRQALRATIDNSLALPAGGVMHALLLGERGLIPEYVYEPMAATGAAHLLAISGMHVGLAALWFFALGWFVFTRSEAVMVRLPVRGIAIGFGLLGAVAYATMAGWPLPAVRATIMLAAAALAWQLRSHSEPVNTLLAALGLMVICDPAAIASLSLWLSFLATAALLLWAGRPAAEDLRPVLLRRLISMAGALMWVSLLASLATLPLIADAFGRIPLYALPANLLMVPIYGLIVLPAGVLAAMMVVCGLDTIASLLMQFAGAGVDVAALLLSQIAELPGGRLWAIDPSLPLQGFYLFGMLLCGWLLWRGRQLRAAVLAGAVLSVWLLLVLHESIPNTARWVVWDVGQGAASTLLLPDGRVIAVDAPGRTGSRFNGGTTVADGLRALGILHLDVMVISHAQADHLGGVPSLLARMNRIGELWLPDVPEARSDRRVRRIIKIVRDRGGRVRWLARGDQIALGKAKASILWPPRGHATANRNNSSLVVRMQLPDRAQLLWPGDIEAKAELAMQNAVQSQDANLMHVDAMLMPHHGSRSSSSRAWIDRVHPSVVIAQVGYANRYGFPDGEVVGRYLAAGAQVMRTSAGAVIIDWATDADRPRIKQWQLLATPRRELVQTWLAAL